ncbi:MAG: hypothetical protein ACK5QU_05445, partial [Bacteroidota bacterium]
NYLLDHTLIKIDPEISTTSTANYNNIIKNPPNILINGASSQPLFANPGLLDYRLRTNAPAIGAGLPAIGQQVPLDLDEYSRDTEPDLGCYEFH